MGTEDSAQAFADIFTREGAADGPLAGLTAGVKDVYDIAGRVTGCGNPAWAASHGPAEADAPAVAALLSAGATVVGKTHTDELAYSLMGANAHYGTPINSADPRRVPGGSSSGSAAAVAAGLVDIGLGGDTGGSVRLPASFCGIWGIRTTHGAVSLDGAMPFTRSFDTVGWFARDGALMDAVAVAYGMPEVHIPGRALLPVDIWARATSATVSAVAGALAKLAEMTGPPTPVLLAEEGLDDWREVFRVAQAAEIWQALGPWVEAHEPNFGPGIAGRFAAAAQVDAAAAAAAEAQKTRIAARMAACVPEGAVLVLPTAPGPAPFRDAPEAEFDAYRQRAFGMLCPAGLSGLPQLSVPAGAVDGGPVGISLIGAWGTERGLIALARAAGLG